MLLCLNPAVWAQFWFVPSEASNAIPCINPARETSQKIREVQSLLNWVDDPNPVGLQIGICEKKPSGLPLKAEKDYCKDYCHWDQVLSRRNNSSDCFEGFFGLSVARLMLVTLLCFRGTFSKTNLAQIPLLRSVLDPQLNFVSGRRSSGSEVMTKYYMLFRIGPHGHTCRYCRLIR